MRDRIKELRYALRTGENFPGGANTSHVIEAIWLEVRLVLGDVADLESRTGELEDPEPDHGEGCKCGDCPQWR